MSSNAVVAANLSDLMIDLGNIPISPFDESTPRGARRSDDPIADRRYVRGQGAYLWDTNGKQYLDFVSGYSSTIFGHCHPRLVQVATEQLGVLTQLVGLPHPWRDKLASKLSSLAPMSPPVQVWLTTTGARAIEVAWKIAFAIRPGRLIAFDLAYHGRSIATAQISHTLRLPILSETSDRRLPFPRCHACPMKREPTTCHAECFDESEAWIAQYATEISAIVVEPIVGARGYYSAPAIFFQRLRAVTQKFGILLIDDEIQMGLGRHGAIFACQRQGWSPDLAILGKSLGGGIVPIAAVLGRKELMDNLSEGYESETFAANPLACRLALESLAMLVDDRWLDRADQISNWLRAELAEVQQVSLHPIRVEVCGAAGIIEVHGSNPSSIARQWVSEARDAGLLLHWSGSARDRIVLIPPLIVEQHQIQYAIDILKPIVRKELRSYEE